MIESGSSQYERPKPQKGQILNASDIKVDGQYLIVSVTGHVRRIRATSLPHPDKEFPDIVGLVVDIEEDTSESHLKYPEGVLHVRQKDTMTLSGVGIIPFEGKWNTQQYLVKATKDV